MKRAGKLFCCCIFVVMVCIALIPVVLAADNFVPVRLLHGVQIELPGSWEVLSKNHRNALNSGLQSLHESVGTFDASSDLNFAANYYDEAGKVAAMVKVIFYPDLKPSQADARATGPSSIRDLDNILHEGTVKEGQTFGFSVLAWNGTSKQDINGITTFVTEYKRSTFDNNGNFDVRFVRVSNVEKSFILIVSYRVDQEPLLRPICDSIISSLRN